MKEYSIENIMDAFNECAKQLEEKDKEIEELKNINEKLSLALDSSEDRLHKAIGYTKASFKDGTLAKTMPHLKFYINGKHLLNILEGEDNEEK